MKKIAIIVSFIVVATVLTAKAQTPRVDQRQQNQRARVYEGIASGELTHREAAHAVHQQGHIRRAERRAKADGRVTCSERARLNHLQNRASRDLRRNKHDAETRW